MNYLTVEAIIEINKQMTGISGDPFVLVDSANLEYIVEAAKYKYEDKQGNEATILKASFLLYQLAAKAHAFAEGNKRTAISSCLAFLSLNGHYFDTSKHQELLDFVLLAAQGEQSINSIHKWLSQRVKRY